MEKGDYNNPLYQQQPSAPPDYQQLHTYSTITNPNEQYIYTVPQGPVPQGPVGQPPKPPTATVQVVSAPPVQPMVVQQSQGHPPNDYLILSIFTAVLCFWPLGIAAIVFSVKTRNAIKKQDYEEARKNSSYTKIFNGVSIGIGIFLWIVVLVAQLAWILPLAFFLSLFNRN